MLGGGEMLGRSDQEGRWRVGRCALVRAAAAQAGRAAEAALGGYIAVYSLLAQARGLQGAWWVSALCV